LDKNYIGLEIGLSDLSDTALNRFEGLLDLQSSENYFSCPQIQNSSYHLGDTPYMNIHFSKYKGSIE